ncbi:GDSL-like Lipase/Acylhydrolase [compost metagenome]
MKRTSLLLSTAFCLTVLMAFTVPKPKRLFILGDSISLQYGSELARMLQGKFAIERKTGDSVAFKNLDIPVGANGGDSRMVLKYLKMKIEERSFKPDLFMLNCGLHDVKRDPKTNIIAVDEKDYRQHLEEIYSLLNKKKIPMVWVRTTGVIDSLHQKNKGFSRFIRDIDRYNTIADEVFASHGVPQIDLYTVTELQGNNRFVDHAHFTPEVRKVQAAFIAGFLSQWSFANQK